MRQSLSWKAQELVSSEEECSLLHPTAQQDSPENTNSTSEYIYFFTYSLLSPYPLTLCPMAGETPPTPRRRVYKTASNDAWSVHFEGFENNPNYL